MCIYNRERERDGCLGLLMERFGPAMLPLVALGANSVILAAHPGETMTDKTHVTYRLAMIRIE